MRTTLDLPDDLLLEAKRVALEQRTTLKQLTAEGLRLVIQQARRRTRRRLTRAPVQLPPGHSLLALSNEEVAAQLDHEETARLNEVYRGH